MAESRKAQLCKQIRDKLNEARDAETGSHEWKRLMRELYSLQDELTNEWKTI